MFKTKADVKPLVRQVLSNGIVIEAVPTATDIWSVSASMSRPLEQHCAVRSEKEAAVLAKLLAEKYESFDSHLAQYKNT